jgi:hypothetical protein
MIQSVEVHQLAQKTEKSVRNFSSSPVSARLLLN